MKGGTQTFILPMWANDGPWTWTICNIHFLLLSFNQFPRLDLNQAWHGMFGYSTRMMYSLLCYIRLHHVIIMSLHILTCAGCDFIPSVTCAIWEWKKKGVQIATVTPLLLLLEMTEWKTWTYDIHSRDFMVSKFNKTSLG